MRRIIVTLVGVIALLAAYLLWWPVPVQPAPWNAPPAPGYTGPHAVNQRLAGLHAIALAPGAAPSTRACSTSSNTRRPAACSSTTRC